MAGVQLPTALARLATEPYSRGRAVQTMNLKHAVRVLGVVLLASGVLGLIMPVAIADFAGLLVEPNTANGRVEIGALYGGVPLALGAIALYSTVSFGASAGPMLTTVGLVFVGAAAGRLIVAFTGDMPTLAGWMMFAFDAVCAVVFLLGSTALDSDV